MIKYCVIYICCAILLLALSCRDDNGILIKGEISNLEYPYILASYTSADTLAIDTISVNGKGQFNYRSSKDTLTAFTLHFNDYDGAAVVFADKGEKISVKGDAQLADLIRVTGNEINDDLTSFKTNNQELLKQRAHLLANMKKNGESDTLSTRLSMNEHLAQVNSFNHELTLNAEEYVKENPAKMSSLILINDFFANADNPPALERVLGYVDGGVVANTPLGRRLKSYSEKINRSGEGAMMPYFHLKDNDGKNIYSHDFPGKHVLLSFISVAGTESRETVEILKTAYRDLNKDSVAFISVYIDSDTYPVETLAQDSIPWTVVTEKNSWGADIVDAYNVSYIPFNILISRDGIIQGRNIPAQRVVDTIKKSSDTQ